LELSFNEEFIMKKISVISVAAVALLVSACGESTGDRTVSGAGLGAGVGAVGSALTGGSVGGGALVGGVVGGAAGALTSPNQVDLGKPAWR
jgi:osmotically inducible lipoprotein OsmB